VLVTEPIDPVGLELLRDDCDLVQPEDLSPASLQAAIAEVDGVVVRFAELTAEVLAAARRLRVISRLGVEVDNVDLSAAAARGILVCYTPAATAEATATLTLGLLLAVSRRLVEGARRVPAGRWQDRDDLLGDDPAGKTLAVVGYGRIGSRLARKCRTAFDMTVYGYSRTVPRSTMAEDGVIRAPSLEAMLPLADYVSLHVPLTAETRGLIDARRLALMKPSAYLINAARGGLVDEPALVEALRVGRLAGAALDVLTQEPPQPDHPLLGLPNVVVVPHLGSRSRDTMRRLAVDAAESLLAGLRGERPAYVASP
jgi:D-3-phosphoglycerate dehydrogenase